MKHEDYHKYEFFLNMVAGGIAGAIAAAVTNPFEAVTVAVQTNNAVIMDLIRKEGVNLLTKGLAARIYYNSA